MPEVNNVRVLNIGEYLIADKREDCYHEIFVKIDNVDPLQAWIKLSRVYLIMRVSEDKYVIFSVDTEVMGASNSGYLVYKKDEFAFDKIKIEKQGYLYRVDDKDSNDFLGDSVKTVQWLERWIRHER